MHCRGCGEDKKLVKAHIIPESFFRTMKADSERIFQVIDKFEKEWQHKKRIPIGVYDKEILCNDCERKFQLFDDYGFKILFESKRTEIKINGEIAFYKTDKIDYKLLKLFFISVIWRASISKQLAFASVNLGKLEDIAKSHIWNDEPGSPDDFSFQLTKFIDTDNEYEKAMLAPERIRFYGVNYYKFYLCGYILLIKADSRGTPDKYLLNTFKIRRDQDLLILAKDFSGSDEALKMFQICNASK